MCGIAGIWSKTDSPVSEEKLRRMLSFLKHRGPDAQGAWNYRNIGLGHSRLKILDLSDAANQPFTDFTEIYQKETNRPYSINVRVDVLDEAGGYFKNNYLQQENIGQLQNIHSFSILASRYKGLAPLVSQR